MKIMSDLIACLYKIAEAIRENKQETESEENQSTESIIVEPVAIGRQYEGNYIIEKFSQESVTAYSNSNSLMFIYDKSQFNNNNNYPEMKQDKLYLVTNYGDGVNSLHNGRNEVYFPIPLLDNNSNKLFDPTRTGDNYNINPDDVLNEDNFVFEDLFIIQFDHSA